MSSDITTISSQRILQLCNDIIELKLPQLYAKNNFIDESDVNSAIDKAEKNMEEKSALKNIENIGSVAGVMGAQRNIHQAYDENKNYMNGARGGAFS